MPGASLGTVDVGIRADHAVIADRRTKDDSPALNPHAAADHGRLVRALSRIRAAVDHAVSAEAIAVAGEKIAEFQAVDGDVVSHPGDLADEERTGLVCPDRISVAHDLLELAPGIRHEDGTDDSVAERGVVGRHTREDRLLEIGLNGGVAGLGPMPNTELGDCCACSEYPSAKLSFT